MRTLKFRAWDKKDKRIVNLGSIEELHLFQSIYHESKWDEVYEYMQYTGLKDKNGKEIYEGDVLEFIDGRGKDKGEVFFDKGKFQVMNFYQASQDEPVDAFSEYADLEIIGNIYETPPQQGEVTKE